MPLGAQVRRTGGVRLIPDSSQKTIHAPRRRAFFYLGPAGLHPAGNRLLVPLRRPAGRTLEAPVHGAQDLPDMADVVAHAGDALDDDRDSFERPQIGGKSVGEGPFQQSPIEAAPLRLREAGTPPRPPGAGQALGPSLSPRLVPAAHAGAGDPERPDHLGLGLAPREHRRRPHSAPLHLLEIPRGARPCSLGGTGLRGSSRGLGGTGFSHTRDHHVIFSHEAQRCNSI